MAALLPSCEKPEPEPIAIQVGEDQVLFSEAFTDQNGEPVEGATLSLWANNQQYLEVTDANGAYSLLLDQDEFPLEGQIALSLYKAGYRILPLVYAAPLEGGRTYGAISTILQQCATCLPVTTSYGTAHELFHVGDDSYNGSANSQFQKSTDAVEGIAFDFRATGSGPIRVSFYAKGVQGSCTENVIRLNDTSFEMDPSPENGDYTFYSFSFDPASGPQTVQLIIAACTFDRDDWEFIGFTVEER